MSKLSLGAEAFIKAEIIARCAISQSHLVPALVKSFKKFDVLMELERRVTTKDAFDEMALLGSLSPTIWMYAHNLPSSLCGEVFKVVSEKHLQQACLTPPQYVVHRLVWLWLQGQCDGRLENRDEYVTRVLLQDTKQLKFDGGKLLVSTVPEDSSTIKPMSEAIGLMYDHGLAGKQFFNQLLGGVRLVFRRSSDPRPPHERARETLEQITLPT